MRTREKAKSDMSKAENSSEAVSRREVGVQDNPCTVTTQDIVHNRPEPVAVMLDKLMSAVDGVSTKIGTIESGLLSLEGEVRSSGDSDCYVSGVQTATGEPLFGTQAMGGVRPKVRKPKMTGTDFDVGDSDLDGKQKKKKKQEKKGAHAVKVMLQEYAAQLSKYTDRTIVEKKKIPTETMTLSDVGLLSQKEVEYWPWGAGTSHAVLVT